MNKKRKIYYMFVPTHTFFSVTRHKVRTSFWYTFARLDKSFCGRELVSNCATNDLSKVTCKICDRMLTRITVEEL